MSLQIIESDLLIELVHQQQELMTGGVDFQTNYSNFEQSFTKTTMSKTNQNQTIIAKTYTQRANFQSSAESSLSINPLDSSSLATAVNSSVVLN
ncbi:MAG: hypothetical protein KAF91_12305 [Nostoc sp. TH1S01]|nr:hypothetical protein [Nostoc sp. TH1S01]